MRWLTSTTLASAALALTGACPVLADTTFTYTFTELPAPPGYHSPKVTGINPSGTTITGSAVLDGTNKSAAVVWIEGEPVVIAEPGQWLGAIAKAANDAGAVVGRADGSGVEWSDAGTTYLSGWQPLPEAVSNTGVIAGAIASGTTSPRAARWVAGQHEVLLPHDSRAFGINDNGLIVGRWKDGSTWRAFLWQDGQWNTLPVSGGDAAAVAINAAGVIAGYHHSYFVFPIKWEGGEMISLTSGMIGWARDLNDGGDIVGTLIPQLEQPSLGAIWQGGSPDAMHFLDDLVTNLPPGWSLETAVAISNTGHIIGTASAADEEHPFLLTPNPNDPGIPGDLNGDGKVGVEDLLILLSMWGPCADCGDCPADLTGDCNVGVADLLILLGNWG